MGKVLSMQEMHARSLEKADINTQLKETIMSFCREGYIDSADLEVFSSLKDWFGKKISSELMARRLIEEDKFLCGLYLAQILSEIYQLISNSFYAVDFAKQWNDSGDPKFLKFGGDLCFILCGIFPERAGHRMMRIQDYRQMGPSFYYHFYSASGQIIGLHMSNNFNVMEQVIRSAMKSYVKP